MNDVVKLSYIDETIAVIALEDKESRNTFTRALAQGIDDSFRTIREEQRAKVVIVHGHDNFFSCGGTQEELINLYKSLTGKSEQKMTFNDLGFFRAMLDCELPCISAMQGHAIGGGLAFGSYADMLIMSENALYATNFMKYGFTPGMGATYIVPLKFGQVIGSEMLFSAVNYQGKELKNRGIGAQVLKSEEVIPAAIKLAKELNNKPRISLIQLKNERVRNIRAEIDGVIDRELKMHEITFQQPEVLQRIESLFGK